MGKTAERILEFIKGLFAKEGTNVIFNIKNSNNNKNGATNNNWDNNIISEKDSINSQKDNHHNRNKTDIVVVKEKVYTTGVNGKVYTTTVYKKINHNFGFEIELVNQTSKKQQVNIGNCIYNSNGEMIYKKNIHVMLYPNEHTTKDIYVDEKRFIKMRNGKYESQTWVNGQRLHRKSVILLDK